MEMCFEQKYVHLQSQGKGKKCVCRERDERLLLHIIFRKVISRISRISRRVCFILKSSYILKPLIECYDQSGAMIVFFLGGGKGAARLTCGVL